MLRYAFAHSINIDKVINKVLRGDYELETLHHGYGDYSNYDLTARRYDPAKVDKYMKKLVGHKGTDGALAEGW